MQRHPGAGEAAPLRVLLIEDDLDIAAITKELLRANGFIVAIACCYKGMTVKGGPQGVGRAVNQAVVLAFAGIWAFSNLFTATMLAAFPETGNLH